MAWLPYLAAVIFLIGLLLSLRKLNKMSNDFKGRGLLRRWRIPTVEPDAVDEIFCTNQWGVTRASEVRLFGGTAPGGTSILEAWILAALSKKSSQMFEFGTCTGRTTYLWAANSPEDATVTTITLAPDDIVSYQTDVGDDAADLKNAHSESKFTEFIYTNTPFEDKVQQLFGDSKQFDESPYTEEFDLIFVDGSHAHSYVLSDSQKALAMLKPGGIVLWHDYRGPQRTKGVFSALNQLSRELPLRRIDGTSLVFYRKPVSELLEQPQARVA